MILQNHGLLTVGRSPDGAAWNFGALERCIEAQFHTLNVSHIPGYEPVKLSAEQAEGVKKYYTDEFQYMTFQPA